MPGQRPSIEVRLPLREPVDAPPLRIVNLVGVEREKRQPQLRAHRGGEGPAAASARALNRHTDARRSFRFDETADPLRGFGQRPGCNRGARGAWLRDAGQRFMQFIPAAQPIPDQRVACEGSGLARTGVAGRDQLPSVQPGFAGPNAASAVAVERGRQIFCHVGSRHAVLKVGADAGQRGIERDGGAGFEQIAFVLAQAEGLLEARQPRAGVVSQSIFHLT